MWSCRATPACCSAGYSHEITPSPKLQTTSPPRTSDHLPTPKSRFMNQDIFKEVDLGRWLALGARVRARRGHAQNGRRAPRLRSARAQGVGPWPTSRWWGRSPAHGGSARPPIATHRSTNPVSFCGRRRASLWKPCSNPRFQGQQHPRTQGRISPGSRCRRASLMSRHVTVDDVPTGNASSR
jgi:hypothetical protein